MFKALKADFYDREDNEVEQNEYDLLANRLIDVLSFKKNLMFSPYLYSASNFNGDLVNGIMLWSQVYENSNYYLKIEEYQLLGQLITDIENVFQDNSFRIIDLGPGSNEAIKNKSLPLLKKLGGKVNTYIPIDCQKKFLIDAVECVSKDFPVLTIQPLIADIFELNKIKYLQNNRPDKTLVFFLGATIGNVEEPLNLLKLLRDLKNTFPPGSYFIITQDANQDFESLSLAYNNQNNADFILNFFYRIKRDYDLKSFNENTFRFIFEWNHLESTVISSVLSLSNQSFIIKNKHIQITKDQKISIIKYYKHSKDSFKKISNQASLEIIKTYTTQTNRMNLQN